MRSTEIIIRGEPKEIAALVLAVQERRDEDLIDVGKALTDLLSAERFPIEYK